MRLQQIPATEENEQEVRRYEGYLFTYTAVLYKNDDQICVYVTWGDDTGDDMYSLDDWEEAERNLDTIVGAQI